ncbi:hypothetical protein vseg_010906 [Gypsophila vaccaria]
MISNASIAAATIALIKVASPSNTNTKAKNKDVLPRKLKEVSPKNIETSALDCVTVMTVGGSRVEDQMLEMKNLLEKLMKDNEKKNKQVDEAENKDDKVKSGDKKNFDDKKEGDSAKDLEDMQKQKKTNRVGTRNEKQLQDLIINAVKSQLGGDSLRGVRYNKPYTRRIDRLRMPFCYQPPMFQKFDGKGSPKQHIAHFVETCNSAGTNGNQLVKQFVCSLKGTAFDWYIDMDPESIDGWDHMNDEFLNRFYSTNRIVSMNELANATQEEEESVLDYINRSRALSLECKERLSESSTVEMCINGMNSELLYILNGIKPQNFQELATCAHDMEITINAHNKKYIFQSTREEEK